jgi:hypothetical protein
MHHAANGNARADTRSPCFHGGSYASVSALT